MGGLKTDGQAALRAIAERNGIGLEAVEVLFDALVAGRGFQAQFNHPALGGMGQWSQGGMIMIGDMFNGDLKARIGAICTELSDIVRGLPQQPAAASHQSQSQGSGQGAPAHGGASRQWWPEELGQAASTGAQNGLRYAFFPQSRRLAIETAGRMAVYDTGDHRISGVSQQQSGDQSLSFTSQHGPVRVTELTPVAVPGGEADAPRAAESRSPAAGEMASGAPQPLPVSEPAGTAAEADIFTRIERLASLHAKGMLTDAEYGAKKAELLARI